MKTPHRIHVPSGTLAGDQIPAAVLGTNICCSAIKRNTAECTNATMARLRFVRMENPPMMTTLYENGRALGCDVRHPRGRDRFVSN